MLLLLYMYICVCCSQREERAHSTNNVPLIHGQLVGWSVGDTDEFLPNGWIRGQTVPDFIDLLTQAELKLDSLR